MRKTLPLLVVLLARSAAPGADRTGEEFFENKVRPAFVEHCVKCHGPEKQQGALRLDTPAAIRHGTDGETILKEGAKSRLALSIARTGDYPMPPAKALPKDAADAILEWLNRGAPLPSDAPKTATAAATKAPHWAFQPVRDPAVPAGAAANPVDRFVASRLERHGLTAAGRADPRTIIRRLSFDLTGLPPTADEVERFCQSAIRNPQSAIEEAVDRLLASPAYGERWARHWMDVARYADNRGYVFTEERVFPYSYTYRDYLIRAFNDDKPYNEFVVEQIAGDKLTGKPDNRHQAALGFVTLGRRFIKNEDTVDDRLDVVFRGLQGLTISCARCHDHKYDPIPTADYYSLYAVFAASKEPGDQPVLDPNDQSPKRWKFEADLAAKKKAAEDYKAAMYDEHLAKYRTGEAVRDYLLAATAARRMTPEQVEAFSQKRKLEPRILNRWREVLANPKLFPGLLGPWRAAAKLPADEFAAKPNAETPVPLAAALTSQPPDTLPELAELYGLILAGAEAPLADAIRGPGGVTDPASFDVDKLVPIAVKKEYRVLRNAAEKFKVESPDAPPRATALSDPPNAAGDAVVFVRGNIGNPGQRVPRRFLAALSTTERKPFTQGSGRLELAEAIADPKNPLTARVMVNRVWGHLFGQGLVRTPSDFGLRSEPPTHPELLDWLSTRFVDDGWSVKQLIRRIVLSDTYLRASGPAPQNDPENRLLSFQNRRRLEWEPTRDSLLAAAGELDRTMYGKSVDLFAAPFPKRRALYAYVDRQNLPGTFRSFDLASPDQHTPQRFLTTVPQQALYLLNNAFVAERARAVAKRPEVARAGGIAERVRAIYRAVLSRDPSPAELELAREFAPESPGVRLEKGQLTRYEQLAQALLLSNEFVFVD